MLVLTACAPLRAPVQPLDDREWMFSARAGLWHGEQSDSANIDWLHCQWGYRIRITGPLGAGGAVIHGDADQVRLERGREEPLVADDPESLARQLGWPLPVSALEHWLLARAVPGHESAKHHDRDGRLMYLSQLGWHIHYRGFEKHGEFWLPSRLDAENDELRLRLIFRRWQLRPDACATEGVAT
jgi:outer membrane lipoprotein LolB